MGSDKLLKIAEKLAILNDVFQQISHNDDNLEAMIEGQAWVRCAYTPREITQYMDVLDDLEKDRCALKFNQRNMIRSQCLEIQNAFTPYLKTIGQLNREYAARLADSFQKLQGLENRLEIEQVDDVELQVDFSGVNTVYARTHHDGSTATKDEPFRGRALKKGKGRKELYKVIGQPDVEALTKQINATIMKAANNDKLNLKLTYHSDLPGGAYGRCEITAVVTATLGDKKQKINVQLDDKDGVTEDALKQAVITALTNILKEYPNELNQLLQNDTKNALKI